jgi:hypothetical protein
LQLQSEPLNNPYKDVEMNIFKTVMLASMFALSSGANAAPLIYTFTGTVNGIGDGGGIIGSSFEVGAAVEYVFLVDFAEDGFQTAYDGTVGTYPDNSSYDYFYSDFVSGGLISGVYPSFTTDGSVEEYNLGYDRAGRTSYLTGGSQSEQTQISSSAGFTNAEVGDSFSGFERAYNTSGVQSYIDSTLTLTSISAVPIPAAAWLFGSALLGLGAIKRKRS